MTKELDLFLKDFGLSTFADDVLNSTLLQKPSSSTEDKIKLKKMTAPNNNNNTEDDDDDDNVPLSKCILPFQQQQQQQSSPYLLKSPIHPTFTDLNNNHNKRDDDDEEDDEDLVPIAVLQDPKAKSLLTFQSAAEKYKKSILERDSQLKSKHHHQQQSHRRFSLEPITTMYHRPSSSSPKRYLNKYQHHPSATVMRSVSAGQKHRYTSKQIRQPHYHDDNENDDDDDIPLFQTCLLFSSMNVKSTNVKVSLP